VARMPRAAATPPPRRRVAVIGSGLAVLTTAHTLVSSGLVDVTVFESRAKAGLGGDAERFGEGDDEEAVVDVPLRMIGRGYYSAVENLARELGIPMVAASIDCSFYGVDARGAARLFVLSRLGLGLGLGLGFGFTNPTPNPSPSPSPKPSPNPNQIVLSDGTQHPAQPTRDPSLPPLSRRRRE